MNTHKWSGRIVHLTFSLLAIFAIFESLVIPFAVFKARHFRSVEVTEIGNLPTINRLFVQVRSKPDIPSTPTILPRSDHASLRVGDHIFLMTADWNIKGPEEQRVTLWRLLKAYHVYLALIYPLLLIIFGIKKALNPRRA